MIAIYQRVSTNQQDNSLAMQLAKCVEYCKGEGCPDPIIYEDEDVSGRLPLYERPQGKRLIDDINSGVVTQIVTMAIDRMFRNASDGLFLIGKWNEMGIRLCEVNTGFFVRVDNSNDFLTLAIKLVVAQHEAMKTAERTRDIKRFQKKTKRVYSPIPFGFDKNESELIPNIQEQKVIERIKDMHVKGFSLSVIATTLNTDNSPTKKGGKWSKGVIHKIIRNELHN